MAVGSTLFEMRLVREFERRMDGLLEGWASRVFSGPLHPTELATRLIRTADLSLNPNHECHNHFEIAIPASGEGAAPLRLIDELERLVEEAAFERGWRMNGPAEVEIRTDPSVRKGSVYVTSGLARGQRPAWAVLRREGELVPITVNRAVIGRDPECDVVIDHDQISRRHARIWTEAESVRVADLGSSNGTSVDGAPVTEVPVECQYGSVVRLADLNYRLEAI
jgi:hypothetical protein